MICRTRKEVVDAGPLKAFISYAHTEEHWKDRLLEALAPLQQDGFVEIWHDGILAPGDQWHAKILSSLADANLVLLLISRAFLESEYARDTELPLAVERAEQGRSRLVPIILESCDWANQPFARYQALPGDRVPIAERADTDYALKDCLERLRGVFDPPQVGSETDGPAAASKERPLLRLVFEFAGPDWPDWSALIKSVREVTKNPEVRTSIATRTGSASEALRWEWLLTGPADAFAKLETAHQQGDLSDALGVKVVVVERTFGSTYFAGTFVADEGKVPPPIDRLLEPGIPMVPPLMFGLAVRPSEPDYLQPFFTKNGNEIGHEEWQREKQKLLGYFQTVLAVPGEDMHVNLSSFEPGRMMPENLARTGLGRLLGEQDCLLKQLTASMLHPRNPLGAKFWEQIEGLSQRSRYKGELEMWQKVWIVAGAATLNEKPAGETYDHPLPPGVEIRGEDWFGHLSECSMRVMCETDYLALNRRAEESKSGGQGRQFHEKALDIFRETILPALEVEVNEGSHFIPLRQVFWAVSLAKWYRERIAETGLHTRLMELAEESRLTLGPSTEIGPGLGAPQWMNDCYDRYIDLLEGVFRVAEPMESPGRRRVRVYQSGGVLL